MLTGTSIYFTVQSLQRTTSFKCMLIVSIWSCYEATEFMQQAATISKYYRFYLYSYWYIQDHGQYWKILPKTVYGKYRGLTVSDYNYNLFLISIKADKPN